MIAVYALRKDTVGRATTRCLGEAASWWLGLRNGTAPPAGPPWAHGPGKTGVGLQWRSDRRPERASPMAPPFIRDVVGKSLPEL